MAVTFNGGVVLGADSRTTMGSYIVRPLHTGILQWQGASQAYHSALSFLDCSHRPTESQTSSPTFMTAFTAAAREVLQTRKPWPTSSRRHPASIAALLEHTD